MSDHFNQLMPSETELLALLAEECGECVQIIGKILRHGLENHNPHDPKQTTNRELLEKEVGDVRAAITRLCETMILDANKIWLLEENKLHSLNRWMHHNYDRDREEI